MNKTSFKLGVLPLASASLIGFLSGHVVIRTVSLACPNDWHEGSPFFKTPAASAAASTPCCAGILFPGNTVYTEEASTDYKQRALYIWMHYPRMEMKYFWFGFLCSISISPLLILTQGQITFRLNHLCGFCICEVFFAKRDMHQKEPVSKKCMAKNAYLWKKLHIFDNAR